MLTVTDIARNKIHKLAQMEGLRKGWSLHFSVVAGGCSGFQYEMRFTEESGITHTINGVPFHIPEQAWPLLERVTIDFNDGLMDSGFKITNAAAEQSCGCGKSFR